MAILDELVTQIENPDLRARIAAEVEKLAKQKKFGLVFEEHLPECTPLWDIPVKKGGKAALKTGQVNDFYTVLKIENGVATCLNKDKSATAEFAVDELVSVAEFGEPIYPYLKPLDTVCNAPDSDLWHTLIEADNYHALQLLEYLYAGKVDCIYIDPPYNTGARDWKYNNDYVDNSDQYRHSKWLSMMQKRLKIAKKLLNPNDSVLIVTIDEKEYLHLGCLLEEMFPESNMQMITSVISRNGTSRENEFSRVEEYLFILRFGQMGVTRTNDNMLSEDGKGVIARVWFNFMRTSTPRSKTKGQFFPIYIDTQTKRIKEIGEPLLHNQTPDDIPPRGNLVAVYPIRDDNSEATWGAVPETTRKLLEEGYLRIGSFDESTNRWSIQYVRQGDQKRVASGEIVVEGKAEDGSLILVPVDATQRIVFPKTVWNRKSHDATEWGTRLLKPMFVNTRFSYPKSLYAVGNAYVNRYYDEDDVLNLKIQVIIFAANTDCMDALNEYAEQKFHDLNDANRRRTVSLPEKFKKKYDDIVSDGDIISKHNFRLPETIRVPHEMEGRLYSNHLFVDDSGTALINLNGWERKVIAEEEQQEDFVCWLRNPSRGSWALCIPYEIDGEKKPTYPDFLIIRRDGSEYVVDILEPHDPTRQDNLGKAKGFAEYARQNPGVGRIQLIRMQRDSVGRERAFRLDMSKSSIRDKVSRCASNDELNHIFESDGFFQ